MILKRRFKPDRRRRKRQLLNTSVQVFTEAAQLDGLGINLSDVGMCLLPWQISRWDLKFRSNFSRPAARNWFEFLGLFAIAPCIYTESIFWWIQINTQVIGQTYHNTAPHLVAEGPVTSPLTQNPSRWVNACNAMLRQFRPCTS